MIQNRRKPGSQDWGGKREFFRYHCQGFCRGSCIHLRAFFAHVDQAVGAPAGHHHRARRYRTRLRIGHGHVGAVFRMAVAFRHRHPLVGLDVCGDGAHTARTAALDQGHLFRRHRDASGMAHRAPAGGGRPVRIAAQRRSAPRFPGAASGLRRRARRRLRRAESPRGEAE